MRSASFRAHRAKGGVLKENRGNPDLVYWQLIDRGVRGDRDRLMHSNADVHEKRFPTLFGPTPCKNRTAFSER